MVNFCVVRAIAEGSVESIHSDAKSVAIHISSAAELDVSTYPLKDRVPEKRYVNNLSYYAVDTAVQSKFLDELYEEIEVAFLEVNSRPASRITWVDVDVMPISEPPTKSHFKHCTFFKAAQPCARSRQQQKGSLL